MKRVKKSGGTHSILLGTTPISFELLYSERKTLSIHLYPDLTIEVDVPTGTPYTVAEHFVQRRKGWLLKHLHALQQRQHIAQLPRRYVSGEQYRYLGQCFTLNVVEDRIGRVRLCDDEIVVGLPVSADSRRVQKLLINWYRIQAKHLFAEQLAACFQHVGPLGIVTMPPLSIRLMKTRWGSCSSKGRVALNLKLIQAPVEMIDYVLLHELCHLKELNHSRRFWALMNAVCPDWKRVRKQLNQYEFDTM